MPAVLYFSDQYTRSRITVPNRPIQPTIGSENWLYATFTQPTTVLTTDIVVLGVIPAGYEVVCGNLTKSAALAGTELWDLGVHLLVTAGTFPTLSTQEALVTATGGDIDRFIAAHADETSRFVPFSAVGVTTNVSTAVDRLLTLTYTTMTTPAAAVITVRALLMKSM